jgi:uncharacterized protein (DUF302 family)
MNTIGSYAIEVTTQRSFEDAIARVTATLAEQGFGVLTEIDVQATFKKKLDLDVRPYRILGACNPQFASRAIAAEPHVGVLMPCNVVVWEEGTHRVITAMEPKIMVSVIDHPELAEVAAEASTRIHAALANVG